MVKRRSKTTNLRFFHNLSAPHSRGFFLTKNFFHIVLGPMRFFLSDSFFLVQFFFRRNSNTQSTHDRFFIFHGMLGNDSSISRQFSWQTRKISFYFRTFYADFDHIFSVANFTKKYHTWIFGILMFILLVITFLSGFQESRSEMLSEQKVSNIALTMHFVLYSLISSGMIFAGLIDATKYNCCHQEIYTYLDNISIFVFGIVLLSIVGIAMRCASRYEMNMVR